MLHLLNNKSDTIKIAAHCQESTGLRQALWQDLNEGTNDNFEQHNEALPSFSWAEKGAVHVDSAIGSKPCWSLLSELKLGSNFENCSKIFFVQQEARGHVHLAPRQRLPEP